MTAFEISLNGTKLCTAGVGELGVLSAIVTWVRRQGEEFGGQCDLGITGLISPTREHVNWHGNPLQSGDEVFIKILEQDTVDEPGNRVPRDPVKDLEQMKEYVKRAAEELGWRIEMNPPASAE